MAANLLLTNSHPSNRTETSALVLDLMAAAGELSAHLAIETAEEK